MAKTNEITTGPKTEPVKRMTLARAVGNIANVKERTPLIDLDYFVNLVAQEESPEGSFPRFMGEFKSTNLTTGDMLTSGNAVLPGVLSRAIEDAKGDAAPSISGRARIGVEPNEEGRPVVYVDHLIAPAQRKVIDLLHHAFSDSNLTPAEPTEQDQDPGADEGDGKTDGQDQAGAAPQAAKGGRKG